MTGRENDDHDDDTEDQDAEPTLNAPGEAGPNGISAPPADEDSPST